MIWLCGQKYLRSEATNDPIRTFWSSWGGGGGVGGFQVRVYDSCLWEGYFQHYLKKLFGLYYDFAYKSTFYCNAMRRIEII